MTESIQEELAQVIGLARSLYSAAHDASGRSDAQLNKVNALLSKLDGMESRVAAAVKAEVGSQFSQAAAAAAVTITQGQEKVNTAAEKAFAAYDAAVRHSAKRILLTWLGAGVSGIAMMTAFAYLTVNHWADWVGYPPTVIPVIACQDRAGNPLQCVRVLVSSGQPSCNIAKDGTAWCLPAKN